MIMGWIVTGARTTTTVFSLGNERADDAPSVRTRAFKTVGFLG